MVKLHLKKRFKKLPNIVIVEGFWNLGKTRLIDYLSKKYNYTIIPEPNHLNENIRKGISKWYRQKHWKRHRLALKQIRQNKRAIMERSIISSLAFDYVRYYKLPRDFKKSLIKIKKLENFLVIFLYGNDNFVKQKLLELDREDPLVKREVLDNPNFCRNYFYFYKNILFPLIDRKMIFLKVGK